jgi:glycosyltransferase involved in cell wall biosynthesis
VISSDSDRPRVLLIVENEPVPSDARVWSEALALRDAGFEVEAICPQGHPGHDDAPFEVREGIPIFRYSPRPADGSVRGYLREYATAIAQVFRLARQQARSRPFDVIHAANPPDVLLPALAPFKLSGTRFVFDQHDLTPELYATRFGKRGLIYATLRLAEGLSFALADVVLSTNDSFRQLALGRGRMRPSDVFVVRNGPDPAEFATAEPDASLKRGLPHLLTYVGLIEPQDGVELALQALAMLRKRRTDWRAVFVGDGGALAGVKALARDAGLRDCLEFTGLITDRTRIAEILATSDVSLSPEPKNALNDSSTLIKVAESMAAGTPVVAFDLTETRITAGKAAAYAVPNEPRDFANAIDRLLDDPVRRARMGAIGRARIARTLAWEHSKDDLLRAYAGLIPNHRPSNAVSATVGQETGA